MSEYDDPDNDYAGLMTRQERREAKQGKEAAFRADNRRSVRIQVMLSSRPKPKRRRR